MLLALGLVGCHQPSPSAAPPPEVTVRQPVLRAVVDYREFTGRIDATERAEIRARVKGFLQVISFQEGAEVKKDDLLYEIDPREYQAALDQAEADVRKQETQLKLAEEEAQRGTELLSGKAISVEEYQQRISTRNAAKAALEQARAAVANAKLQLSFTKIYSPIAGRISRTLVTQGNLVGFSDPTLLTTVVAVDPVYVYFEVPERDFLEYQALIREQGVPTAEQGKVPVYVGLANEDGFPHQGIIKFRNNQVDLGTGTIQLRGTLPNPDRVLTPGLFARVRVPVGSAQPRLLVPEVALSSDQRGQFLLVVKADNSVVSRPVKTGATTDDGMVVILKGVQAQDWVVVDGLQRARPGAKVRPVKGK
jgi:multidrug efflux system membrane fusion protein